MRGRIDEELGRLQQSALASHVLDLPRMRRLADEMPRVGANVEQTMTDYRYALSLGLMVGRFLRWFESRA
jgi:hypothetical protein